MIRKNWQVFINSGFVIFSRIIFLTAQPFRIKYVVISILSILFIFIGAPLLHSYILGSTSAGFFSRLFALDKSLIFNYETPRFNNDEFYEFSRSMRNLEEDLKSKEDLKLLSAAKVLDYLKSNSDLYESVSEIRQCTVVNNFQDLLSGDFKNGKLTCRATEEHKIVFGYFDASERADYKRPMPMFFILRKVNENNNALLFWKNEYSWKPYILSFSGKIQSLTPNSRAGIDSVVSYEQIPFAIQKIFPDLFLEVK